MIGLEIRFLTGRFHANRWQNAHNEGIAEWPPSPWRILRALAAAAFDLDVVAEAKALIEKLGPLPRYRLPPAREAHTRHYMPDTDDAKHEKAKVFDSFVVVDGGSFRGDPQPVTVVWPIALTTDERALLERLASRVGYLGRAESWSELSVVSADNDGDEWDCWPDERASGPSTTLMALEPAAELAAWVATQPTTEKGKRGIPRSAWDVATFEAERFRDEGWSKVPGTRLARYVFARQPFETRGTATRSHAATSKPTVARYAIRSAVLPRMTDALLVAERMRTGLMSNSRRVSGDAKPVFSGHFEDSAAHAHEHAMILPSDDFNGEGRIDTITVVAPMGFDSDDQRALGMTRRLYGRDEHFLDLILIGLGDVSDYGGLCAPYSRALATSRLWRSLTPFIPTRHPKTVRGQLIDDIPAQIRRACAQLGIAIPVLVEPYDEHEWFRYRRRRRSGGGKKGPDRAFGLQIRFDQPQRGPIALGYGAHLGLGCFVAVDDG